MKYLLPVIFFCCLSGCKSNDADKLKPKPRELSEAEKTLVGSYSNISGEQEIKLVLDENGYCELLQDDKKLDDSLMKWGILSSEVNIQHLWFSKWRDMYYFSVENNGNLKLVAEAMSSDKRVDLPKRQQSIYIRIDD